MSPQYCEVPARKYTACRLENLYNLTNTCLGEIPFRVKGEQEFLEKIRCRIVFG